MVKLELTQDEFDMLVAKLKWMRCVVRDTNLDYKKYCNGQCNSECNRKDLLNFEGWLKSKVIEQ